MFDTHETRMIGLPCGEKKTDNMLSVLIEYRNVRRTDRIAISISRVTVLMTCDKNNWQLLNIIC